MDLNLGSIALVNTVYIYTIFSITVPLKDLEALKCCSVLLHSGI
jgi:hypothetical protein